jgi:hypothetical protein
MPKRARDLFGTPIAKLPPAKEFATHAMVADVLDRWGAPGWVFNHCASGEYRTAATAGRLKRMGVKPGWPDLVLLSPAGRAYFLELKRKGEKLTPSQRAFEDFCETGGQRFAHAVAWSFDEALGWLKMWGAIRASVTA